MSQLADCNIIPATGGCVSVEGGADIRVTMADRADFRAAALVRLTAQEARDMAATLLCAAAMADANAAARNADFDRIMTARVAQFRDAGVI